MEDTGLIRILIFSRIKGVRGSYGTRGYRTIPITVVPTRVSNECSSDGKTFEYIVSRPLGEGYIGRV